MGTRQAEGRHDCVVKARWRSVHWQEGAGSTHLLPVTRNISRQSCVSRALLIMRINHSSIVDHVSEPSPIIRITYSADRASIIDHETPGHEGDQVYIDH